MKFANINMLFMIWAVPLAFLVCFHGMRRIRAIISAFCDTENQRFLNPAGSSKRRWLKNMLLLFCLLFTAVAMAGPRYGFKWREVERKGVDIFIAVDCSKSMLSPDIKPSRLERAKREVMDLLSMLEGDRIGLVPFAGVAFIQCPLTLDYNAFYLFLKDLSPGYIPLGGTNMAGAIDAALGGFSEKDDTKKAIILITDGESTGGDPIESAKRAQKKGVKIFCIGVGSEEGVPVPEEGGGFKKDKNGKIVLSRLDEATLKKIASITGGDYVRSVAGDMDLDRIYRKNILGSMERKTVSSGREKVWEDRFQWFLGPAVLFLALAMGIPSAVRSEYFVNCPDNPHDSDGSGK